jgi:hypothetical protein
MRTVAAADLGEPYMVHPTEVDVGGAAILTGWGVVTPVLDFLVDPCGGIPGRWPAKTHRESVGARCLARLTKRLPKAPYE